MKKDGVFRTSRRAFVQGGALSLLLPGWAQRVAGRAAEGGGPTVNDIHSQLNATVVRDIVRPRSVAELQAAVARAATDDTAVSIAGGRHAMGGQQFGNDTVHVDTTGLGRVLSLDRDAGIVDVEGGIQWPGLLQELDRLQAGESRPWGIVQKQTGADRLSIGGALSANVHGRGLTHRPIIQDVESFVLVDAQGDALTCSRDENAELFRLAIGGYGLFGAIASVRLRLERRRKIERVVEIITTDELMDAFDERIAAGFLFGDFQYATAESSPDFLRRGVFSCYRPVADDTPIPSGQSGMSAADFVELGYLSHADRRRAFEVYSDFYLRTSGQIYWSDTHQMSYYLDDYHAALSQRLSAADKSTEMITEIYVPRPALADFMRAAAGAFRQGDVDVIYGTVRLIERDEESFLAWAREPWACVIFNLHVTHTESGIERAAAAFRRLIDVALEHGGSYYLTYHRWARRDQVEAAYPQLESFLENKRRYDPEERFQSDWYRHYRSMFSVPPDPRRSPKAPTPHR